MTDSTTALAQPVTLSTNRARGGVTGHRVRYVLALDSPALSSPSL